MDDAAEIAEIVPGVEPIPAPDVDFIEQFIHIIPALWRTMKRAAVSGRELPANESQVTILRLVIHHGGLTPAQLAEIMHLARPTISNLLKSMAARGLVARVVSQKDARMTSVIPTERGRKLLEQFRNDRAETVRAAFATLSDREQRRITAAAPSLRHLLRELERFADAAEAGEARPVSHP